MRIWVQKYGGSSVADLERIQGVARRIARCRQEGVGLVVVVSAMGNTTNELLALASQLSRAPDRRELDMLLSVGERVTMSLLAIALREMGIPALSLTGSQSGIVTDEHHADARVVEVRPDRIRKHLEDGHVVIVAGFQGVSRSREVTTLGRGGSDTTAVVLAAALGAEHCELCSDVDGIWTADPRLVPSARKLDELSLDQALTLARSGAKVLFEDAVRMARDGGVQVVASATFGPGSGTRLTTNRPRARVVAIAGDDHLLRLDGPSLETVRDAQTHGARLRGWHGAMAWLDLRNAHDATSLRRAGAPSAVVTAVGSQLGSDVEAIARAEGALREAGVPTAWRTASEDHLAWEVPPSQLADAVRALHRSLVEASP